MNYRRRRNERIFKEFEAHIYSLKNSQQWKGMLRKALTSCLFLGLLSSVRCEGAASDSNYRNFLAGSFKEKCSNLLDQSACIYWDSLPEESSDYRSAKAPENQEQDGLSLENSTASRQRGENSEEFVFDIPAVDFRNDVNKRFSVFRRRNTNAQGYKRGPGFRSWGGKRNFQYMENPIDKKTKFTSWGGKRDDFSTEIGSDKRSKFVSWGGKRDFDYLPDKKTGFKSWGGKRSSFPATKRDAEIPNPSGMEKRNPILKNVVYLDEPYKNQFPKRPQFQSWGGKRALYPLHRVFAFFYGRPVTIMGGEKRKFSSWGGKRNYENEYDRGEMKDELKRHNFQSWGGKRAFEGESEDASQSEETNSKGENSDLNVRGQERGGGR